MPRTLTPEEEARFLGWAQQRERLMLRLRSASVSEKVHAYKQLEKQILQETRTAFEQQEMRRRITEDLLMATRAGPWRRFSPYLRRMERLGYSSLECRVLVCAWAAQAAGGSRAGLRKTASLIADFERRVARARTLHPNARKQLELTLTHARSLTGIGRSSPG